MNETKCGRGISMEVQATERSYVGISMTVQPQKFIELPSLRKRSAEAIKRLGTPVHLIREEAVNVETFAILSPLQRISSPQTLAIIRTAWFIPGDDIQGGDYVFDLNRSVYYIFLAKNEYIAEGEIVGMMSIVVRCNRVCSIYREIDKPTGFGGTLTDFELMQKNVPISVEFIKGSLRGSEPGFYGESTHRCYLPKFYGLQSMDRIRINDDYLRVDVIDTISFDNVDHCTLTRDGRPNEDS